LHKGGGTFAIPRGGNREKGGPEKKFTFVTNEQQPRTRFKLFLIKHVKRGKPSFREQPKSSIGRQSGEKQ